MRGIGLKYAAAAAGIVLLGAALAAVSAAKGVHPLTTSFDCAEAASVAEQAICSNRKLAGKDIEMASLYKGLLAHLSATEMKKLRHEQRDWLKDRNRCGSSPSLVKCLRNKYDKRIAVLKKLGKDLESAPAYTKTFVSPDKICRLLYEGPESDGVGAFYDVTNGGKVLVHKEYLRIGPIVNWLPGPVAELLVSEGSPAYHSSYYDCRGRRTSPSFFQSIAFDPARKVVATLDNGAILFYRLFSDKEFYRAGTPDVDMMEYLMDCDSDAVFGRNGSLHVTMKKCAQGRDVDLTINVPD